MVSNSYTHINQKIELYKLAVCIDICRYFISIGNTEGNTMSRRPAKWNAAASLQLADGKSPQTADTYARNNLPTKPKTKTEQFVKKLYIYALYIAQRSSSAS